MTKIIMNGCNGKMGQVITRLVSEDNECEIVAGFDVNDSIENTYPVFTNPDEFTGDADVIIDFSSPAALPGLLGYQLHHAHRTAGFIEPLAGGEELAQRRGHGGGGVHTGVPCGGNHLPCGKGFISLLNHDADQPALLGFVITRSDGEGLLLTIPQNGDVDGRPRAQAADGVAHIGHGASGHILPAHADKYIACHQAAFGSR